MARAYFRRYPGDTVGQGKAELVQKIDNRLWDIRCKCGTIYTAQPSETTGFCRRCAYEVVRAKNTKHGESPNTGKKATRLYIIWCNMRSRCKNENNPCYHDYGGRGIEICDAWNDYLTFKIWAITNGYADNLSIDRIDVNGNYAPDNCRWVDQEAQMQNTRSTIKVDGVSLKKWCGEHDINYDAAKAYRRHRPEMPLNDILNRYLRLQAQSKSGG